MLTILYECLLRYPTEFIGGRIGIITPYKSQLSLLRSRFLNAFGSSTIDDIEFNTVDGFQGREVDILLLSTVRAAHSSTGASEVNASSIGFVADVRRMNVALTRAKLSLWILGNARTLQTNRNWAALVKDAKERNMIVTAKMPYHSMFKTAKNKCFLENSDNHARRLKCEKVKKSGYNITKKLVNDNDTLERKEKCAVFEVKDRNNSNVVENTFSALGKNALCKDRNSEDKNISRKKATACVVAKRESRSSSDEMPMMLDHRSGDDGREGKYKMKMERPTSSKRQSKFQNSRNDLDHTVEKADGRHKASKLSEPERLAIYSEGDRNRSSEVSASSVKECHKDRDADNEGRAPNQSKVAEISKRKQQREAVDAILNSCLISTKKDDRSTKASAKRPFSSSVANGSMKPPKKRSGKLPKLSLLIFTM